MNKKKSILITELCIWVIISTLLFMLAYSFGMSEYNYEVSKCTNLKTSNYNFNVDIQINANYASNCYRTLNYPFEKALTIGVFMITAILFSILILLIIIYAYVGSTS